jgi:hypothetical protein
MTLVQYTRTEPTLKEISAHPIGKILHPRVTPVRFPDRPRQQPCIVRNHDKMGMICHQAPSENLDREPFQFFAHEIEIGNPITIIIEDRNRSYAALRNVMGIP